MLRTGVAILVWGNLLWLHSLALIWLWCGLLRGFERAASFARGAAGVVSDSRTGAETR